MSTIASSGRGATDGAPAASENTRPERAARGGFWQRHRLAAYIAKRLLGALVTVLAASVLIYVALIVLPGDVVSSVLGRSASPAQIEALRRDISGGEGAVQGYFSFLGGLLTGNLGVSTIGLVSGQRIAVGGLIAAPLGHSLALAALAMICFLPAMLVLGTVTGLRPGSKLDGFISATALTLGSLPEYFVAAVLIAVFFNQLNLLPPVSSGAYGESIFSDPRNLVLPVLSLLVVSLAFGSRQLRGSVANILSQDYVTFAQLNGYDRRTIIRKYILPNSIGPTIQIAAQQLQYLISGLVIVETVFNYPGIANLFVRSLTSQDIQMTLVIATILAAFAVLINLLADVLAVLIDPVQRTSL